MPMRMVPSTVSEHVKSGAERRLFGLLKECQSMPGSVAVHSLNLARHDYKLVGELDFVVVGPQGLLVLEVKGGGVSRRDGVWFFTDRYGREHRRSEGPFEQARTGMFSLVRRLGELLPASLSDRLSFGFGVVMPDVLFEQESVEWDADLVLDLSSFAAENAVGRYLNRLSEYWREKHHTRTATPLGKDEVAEIVRALRPDFDRVPPLGHRASELDVQMTALTAEQYEKLDAIERAPRIVIEGGAGTGKTFLAVETARRHAAEGQRVLLTCESPVLSRYIRRMCPEKGVSVLDFASLRLQGQSDDPYEVLVVDETQDILELESLAVLDGQLAGGLECGCWRLFLDPNQQSEIAGRFDRDAYALIVQLGAVPLVLKRNCRNTEQIVKQTQLLTGADMGVASAGIGPAVDYVYFASPEMESIELSMWLQRMVAGGAELRDVTILSPHSFPDSSASLLSSDWLSRIAVVGRDGAWPPSTLSFATISEFKGLENRYVALVDLESVSTSRLFSSLLYVGMSRARAVLWLAVPRSLRSRLRTMSAENLERLVLEQEKGTRQ